MQKNDRRPIGRTRFGVSNVQKPASICFSGANDVCVPGLVPGGRVVAVCAVADRDHAKLGAATAVKAAAPMK